MAKDTLKAEQMAHGHGGSKGHKPPPHKGHAPKAAAMPAGHAEEMEKYRTENDLRALHEAEAIRNDPDRMGKVKELAEQHMHTLKKVVRK
jgi:hypothetical protein